MLLQYLDVTGLCQDFRTMGADSQIHNKKQKIKGLLCTENIFALQLQLFTVPSSKIYVRYNFYTNSSIGQNDVMRVNYILFDVVLTTTSPLLHFTFSCSMNFWESFKFKVPMSSRLVLWCS